MATAKKVHVLDCGAMSCDLTWLLLKPGRSIRPRADKDRPVEWYPCTTHAVLVETDEGNMLWDTSCPRDWETRWAPTGLHLKSGYYRLDFHTVSAATEFLPGVTLIQAPGHTPGQMAMRVDLPDTGTMIFTSDAVYMGDSYGPPSTPAAIVNDLGAWYSSVEKIRGIAEETNATVVFGHDAAQLRGMRLAPTAHYA